MSHNPLRFIGIAFIVLGSIAIVAPSMADENDRGGIATTLTSALTYQGELKLAGAPYNGVAGFQFRLYDALAGGNQVGPALIFEGGAALTVSNGRFTVKLDFGPATMNGQQRWLDITVSGTPLSPRQELTAAPYAQFATAPWGTSGSSVYYSGGNVGIGIVAPSQSLHVAGNAKVAGWIGTDANAPVEMRSNNSRMLHMQWADDGTRVSPNIITGHELNSISAGVVGATISGGGYNGPIVGPAPNTVTHAMGTIGGGAGNTAAFTATVGGGFGNEATGQHAAVTGGFSNEASGLSAFIGSGNSNVASGEYTAIGGGFFNKALGHDSTVGGGSGNEASTFFATVAGGIGNTAGSTQSTVGGGRDNTAGTARATVAGGQDNSAGGSYSSVLGGQINSAGGFNAVICGGQNNIANGGSSMIPGGFLNVANGDYSFAAGRRARATHNGSFVWGDSTDANVNSFTANSFNARAIGGFYFYTNTALSTGAIMAPGGGSWSALSDRNVKQHVQPVNAKEVLAKLQTLPIATWNYTSQDPSIRHMGPMAQDFREAFAVGEDDKHITSVDADGVALASIQGLHQIVQEKDSEIAELRLRVGRLEKLVEQVLESQSRK